MELVVIYKGKRTIKKIIGFDLVSEDTAEKVFCHELPDALAAQKASIFIDNQQLMVIREDVQKGISEVSLKILKANTAEEIARLLNGEKITRNTEVGGFQGRACKVRYRLPKKKIKRG